MRAILAQFKGVEQGGQTNALPRSKTAPEWEYPHISDPQDGEEWTRGGTGSKRAVLRALEIAELDHIQRLLHGTLATRDKDNAIQFEAGIRRLKDTDRIMREIIDRVYGGDDQSNKR